MDGRRAGLGCSWRQRSFKPTLLRSAAMIVVRPHRGLSQLREKTEQQDRGLYETTVLVAATIALGGLHFIWQDSGSRAAGVYETVKSPDVYLGCIAPKFKD